MRVDVGGNPDDVTLRIDRVATPWSLEQVERALLTGRAFERFAGSGSSRRGAGGRVLRGYASGTMPGGSEELKMEYLLVDLGRETVVIRYLGLADQVPSTRRFFASRFLTSRSGRC